MPSLREEDDFQPITWLGKHPIHTATLLVLLHVAALLGCVAAATAGISTGFLGFSSAAIYRGLAFWQYVTYPFVHAPTLWFAIEMYLLFSFGREVEKFLGRKAFLKLYVILLLAPPCLLTAWGLFAPAGIAGSRELHFAVFIAFATLYPDTQLLFRFVTKWVALVLLAIATLQYLSLHRFDSLLVMWMSAGLAYGFIRRILGRELIPGIRFTFRRSQRQRQPLPSRPRRRRIEEEDPVRIIDPLLDKIARSGLSSLTPRERARLERARARLLEQSKD